MSFKLVINTYPLFCCIRLLSINEKRRNLQKYVIFGSESHLNVCCNSTFFLSCYSLFGFVHCATHLIGPTWYEDDAILHRSENAPAGSCVARTQNPCCRTNWSVQLYQKLVLNKNEFDPLVLLANLKLIYIWHWLLIKIPIIVSYTTFECHA